MIIIKKINRVNRAFANFSKQRAAVAHNLRELEWLFLRHPKNKAAAYEGTQAADGENQNCFGSSAQSSTNPKAGAA
jgi:hypothetical protein